MGSRRVAIAFRLVAASAALVAIGVQLFAVHIPAGYSVVNFFSYFTNLSNLLIGVVFIASAVRLAYGRRDPSDVAVGIRGAAVVYIAFVGLVFNTLLRDVPLGDLLPWVNVVLHVVLPLAGLADWILWPPRRRLPWRIVGVWMLWPALYTTVALVRGGALDGFYPYPFFDPAASGGYGGVAALCGLMLLGFLVIALGVRALAARGGGRTAAGADVAARTSPGDAVGRV